MQSHTYLRTHTLQAERMLINLEGVATELRAAVGDHDRHSVTLVRESGLSVTVTFLRAATDLHDHAAPGPITIQVVSGHVRFRVGDEQVDAPTGWLIAFDAGVHHAVHAVEDSTLLLTLVEPRETPTPRG